MANSQHRVYEQGGLSSTHRDGMGSPSGLAPGDGSAVSVGAADSVQGEAKPTLSVPQQQCVCAWCGSVTREGPLPASHGLCPDCRATYFPRPSR